MITGTHTLLYSRNPELDRSFFRDVLALPNIDVGEGWLIFGLPPSEVAVHEAADTGGSFELYLMCEEVNSFVSDMQEREVACTPVEDRGWGLVTHVSLPGGGTIGVYEPRHPRPESPGLDSNGKSEMITLTPPPSTRKRAAERKTKTKKKANRTKAVPKSAGKSAKAKPGKKAVKKPAKKSAKKKR